ncbi:hypothetical protein CTI12_AA572790 [Artemisia annua]|uniref:OTU domain-containing protein n=1 Tax=Artemisia annua TaxID=35608 RepID=A0A2U1KS33_ARTAN|nr:hypothetical protein CTI12_AA572790 [Artemisia annua]
MSFFDDGQFFYGTEDAQNYTWTPPFFDDGQFCYGTEEAQNFTSPFSTDEIHELWLDKYKTRFVSASIDQSLNFGNRTSNRVESQNAKLKKYLESARINLDKFVGCIDKIVKSQLTAIRECFGKSEISRYHHHNKPCFDLLRGFISNEALVLMVKEIDRSNEFQLDSSTCGCQLYNSCGFLCACRLSLYMTSGECIPLDSIDIFWRTLDLSPTTSLQSDNICCDAELNHVKEHFNIQTDAGKRSVLRKLVDIFNPSKTTIKPPKFENLSRQSPKVFHPCISNISLQDVEPDGNCGFRSVALGLGLTKDDWPIIRSDLVLHLESHQEQYRFIQRWRFHFPLWSSPSQSDSNEIIVIAHVHGNHYIRVALREGFPLPITHPLWITYRNNVASGWGEKYAGRQNDFSEYYRREPEHYDLT